jgi:hypothetical protein
VSEEEPAVRGRGKRDRRVERREKRLGGASEESEPRRVDVLELVPAWPGPSVRGRGDPDRGDPCRENRRLFPVAERERERDELIEETWPAGLAARLHLDALRRGAHERRGRRAAVQPGKLEPRGCRTSEPVERHDGEGAPGERRVRDEPRGPERAVRAAVGREEDQRVERPPRGLGRPRGGVRAGQLDERGGPARVVVGACRVAVVVSVGNEDDRVVERSLDDGREVLQLDPPDTGHVLPPAVLAHREPVERELVAEPVGSPAAVERARDAVGVLAGELRREG